MTDEGRPGDVAAIEGRDGAESSNPSNPTVAAWGPVALAALLAFLYIAAFDWAATRVYLLNFSTAGPNLSAVLLLLFATGWVLAVAGVLSPSARVLYVGGTALAGLGIVLGFVGNAAAAGLGGVVAMTAATPVLVGLLAATRERFALGVAGGLLVHAGVRIWLVTISPYGTVFGRASLVVVALVAVGLAWATVSRGGLDAPDWSALPATAAPAFALLALEATWLGMPHTVARWTPRPYSLSAAAAVLGIAGGAALVALRGPPTGRALVAWGGAFTVSVAALLFVPLWPVVVLLAPAQAGAVALLAAGCRRLDRPLGIARSTTEALGVQVPAVVLVFLYVAAVNWAYMPGALGALVRGTELPLLLAIHALLPAAVATTIPRTGREASAPVDRSRRAVAGGVGAGLLGLAGLVPGAVRGFDTAADPADPYRLMTFNVHQYLDGTGHGGYNFGAVVDVIRESEADVIGLQESEGARVTTGNVDGVRWLATALGYHAAYGPPAAAGTFGVALLSRWPIEDAGVFYLPVGDSIRRPTLVATVRTPDGPLPVVVTHFEVGKETDRHVEAARRVLDAVAADPAAAVLGDFNFRPGNRAYDVLDAQLVDAWVAARGPGGGHTWHADGPDRRIDYAWLKGDWEVHDAEVVGSPLASDHLAVVTEATPPNL